MAGPAVSTRKWAARSKGQALLERHQGEMMTLLRMVNSLCIVPGACRDGRGREAGVPVSKSRPGSALLEMVVIKHPSLTVINAREGKDSVQGSLYQYGGVVIREGFL